ncbi:HEXXH motif-containing putative peptide modification protein [Amycolatopsis sp., V23-08]|uniref:HEXXH motif-containing putative peptide modification protein n=1 Tax=Amycolatopsis heterodermiae TaxID=3110235 RepID=A0ABU5QWY0_9PSEU|nr:HEXXH motif-containing putative peptide modification protein [Amycolatopsis sp., V23-08]MEA5358368.1 HEXXH motif-containing putative peptide modification protein [Amycolatopsis sp., V23-08]
MTTDKLIPHHLSWTDFDAFARGGGGPGLVGHLRATERSRRLLLLRGIIDQAAKSPEVSAPLPSPEWAWELLARIQQQDPAAVETILAHPYTGSWAGYTTRLCRQDVTGVCPFWVHLGHVHCLAAAAAVRAGAGFEAELPIWQGTVSLPTLGMVRLRTSEPFGVARVAAGDDGIVVRNRHAEIRLPDDLSVETANWLPVRRITSWHGDRRLSIRLDDLDPYRGLYEPIPPKRLTALEVESWRTVVHDAWQLLATHVPDVAEALPAGLESLVPAPAVAFRLPSASTGEAFGSAIVAYSGDSEQLAAALVHEFQHIRLGGVQHLATLHTDDPRERLYAPWRDDPRPIGGVLHGIYAFFGVTGFWRALAMAEPENALASFEFALSRSATWRTLREVRGDASLTSTGHRFLDSIAAEMTPWQDESLVARPGAWAMTAAADHYATWRLRHLRPDAEMVAGLAAAWRRGESWPKIGKPAEPRTPTPVPDGRWTNARTDLIRLRLGRGETALAEHGHTVPGVTDADLALVAGRLEPATAGYRRLLAADPDDPAAFVGLGLALTACGTGPAARALLHRPELVRAVHRALRANTDTPPPVETIAGWIGRFTH